MISDHIEHELFLLMLNLSQMHDEDQIKKLFLDSLNAITDHCQLRYLSDGDDAPAKILDIMTSKNDFGKLGMDYTAGMVSNEWVMLISNAVSLLSVILEKCHTEKILSNEKLILQEAVSERTKDLELSNQALKKEVEVRTRAEKGLREKQRQLTILMSNLPGMAYQYNNDSDWTMKFVSEGCYSLTGYRSDELLNNKKLAYADIIHSEDRQMVYDNVQDTLKNNSTI